MSKIDDLPDDPLQQPDHEDIRSTSWFQFAEEIEELLATGRYSWAEDTLEGIKESVQKFRVVTDNQRRAVRNIEAGAARSEGRRGSRRYEGWSR